MTSNSDFLTLPTNLGTLRLKRAGFSDYHPDLSIELYREELGDSLQALTIEDIKKHRIRRIRRQAMRASIRGQCTKLS